MLRSLCSRVLQSRPSTSTCTSFHTSAPLFETQRKRKSRAAKAKNISKRSEVQALEDFTRPHPVLGTPENDDTLWRNSELAKVIITRELLSSDTTDGSTTTTEGGAQLPKYLNFGLTPSSPESILLFSELPELAQKVPFLNEDLSKARGQADWINHWAHRAGSANKNEERARDLMLKLVDLKNASSEGLKFENRRRIVEAFGEPGKSNDTGRPEVQAALLTYKIRNLHSHLTRTRRDIHNRRSLRHLVHQRAKVLKYLKGVSRERYAEVLERLGLDRRAVEGEIIV